MNTPVLDEHSSYAPDMAAGFEPVTPVHVPEGVAEEVETLFTAPAPIPYAGGNILPVPAATNTNSNASVTTDTFNSSAYVVTTSANACASVDATSADSCASVHTTTVSSSTTPAALCSVSSVFGGIEMPRPIGILGKRGAPLDNQLDKPTVPSAKQPHTEAVLSSIDSKLDKILDILQTQQTSITSGFAEVTSVMADMVSKVENIVPTMQSYNFGVCQSLQADLRLALQQLAILQEGSSTIPHSVMCAIMTLTHEAAKVWDHQKPKEN